MKLRLAASALAVGNGHAINAKRWKHGGLLVNSEVEYRIVGRFLNWKLQIWQGDRMFAAHKYRTKWRAQEAVEYATRMERARKQEASLAVEEPHKRAFIFARTLGMASEIAHSEGYTRKQVVIWTPRMYVEAPFRGVTYKDGDVLLVAMVPEPETVKRMLSCFALIGAPKEWSDKLAALHGDI